MKIRPVGAELFHAGRQDEIKSLAFRNFANKTKKHKDVMHSVTYQVTSTEPMATFTEKRSWDV